MDFNKTLFLFGKSIGRLHNGKIVTILKRSGGKIFDGILNINPEIESKYNEAVSISNITDVCKEENTLVVIDNGCVRQISFCVGSTISLLEAIQPLLHYKDQLSAQIVDKTAEFVVNWRNSRKTYHGVEDVKGPHGCCSKIVEDSLNTFALSAKSLLTKFPMVKTANLTTDICENFFSICHSKWPLPSMGQYISTRWRAINESKKSMSCGFSYFTNPNPYCKVPLLLIRSDFILVFRFFPYYQYFQ